MNRLAIWISAAPLALVCLVANVLGQDRVFPLKGAPAIGQVKEITREKVVVEVRGMDQTFPANEILKIVFDEEPSNMGRGRDLVTQQQFEQGLDELKKVDVAAIKRDMVKKDYEFYRAYAEGRIALAGQGGKAAAIKSLLAAAKSSPNSNHFWEVSELLGELETAKGNPDGALIYFKKLGEAPFADVKIRAKYREGNALVSKGKLAEAKDAFSQIQGATTASANDIRFKAFAEIGMATVMVQEGAAQEALTKLNDMIKAGDSADAELFAKLYNAQGAALVKLGKPSEAILAYLHTDLLFFSESEAHAEALYHLGQLWPSVNESQRATDAKARLTANYAGSAWASK